MGCCGSTTQEGTVTSSSPPAGGSHVTGAAPATGSTQGKQAAMVDDRFVPYMLYCRGFMQESPLNSDGSEKDWYKCFQNIIAATNKFNVICIDSLNVQTDGSLRLQNAPASVEYFVKNGQLNPYYNNSNGTAGLPFSDYVNQLKQSGITYVGFTSEYGPDFGNNWQNIVAILKDGSLSSELFNNFKVLLTLGINMWDSDYEGGFTLTEVNPNGTSVTDPSTPLLNAHYAMYKELSSLGFARLTCSPPYDAGRNAWIQIAINLYKNLNKQVMNGMNIQTYGSCTPSNYYNGVSQYYASMGLANGTSAASDFINAGISCYDWSLANNDQASLQRFQSYVSDNRQYIGGACVWQLYSIYGGEVQQGKFDFSRNWADLYAKAVQDGYNSV